MALAPGWLAVASAAESAPDVSIFCQIGVSMMPGCTLLQRMPSFMAAHSMATALLSSRTAPLLAQ